MATTTAQERAANAALHRSKHARRRRFSKAAAEIKGHPECLDQLAQIELAEALVDCGWIVIQD